MTNLHEVNFGINQYCGPAVLSAITGESTDRCAAVISAVSGKTVIKAVSIAHLKEAFKRLRFNVTDIDTSSTLYGTILRLAHKDGFYIIMVPKHVIVIEVIDGSVYLVDNASKTPLPAGSSARLMQSVECAFKVSPKDTPVFVRSEIRIDGMPSYTQIRRVNIYENADDNTIENLGSIRYNSISELEQIINELAKIGEV